jgi:hypothetical protein
MENEFVKYEIALELKELGFDEPCLAHYNSRESYNLKIEMHSYLSHDKFYISAPLYQQAFRWFREKYNLHAEPYTADMGAIEYCFQIRDLYSEKYVYDNFVGAGSSYSGAFNTFEEAELECLKKLIELVKENN